MVYVFRFRQNGSEAVDFLGFVGGGGGGAGGGGGGGGVGGGGGGVVSV
jgi:hypothetical protein